MENNNENNFQPEIDNQVNSVDNNQPIVNDNPPMKKNNSALVLLMSLIIIGLVGFLVYTQFIKKDDKDKPKDNNSQEQGGNNSTATPEPVVVTPSPTPNANAKNLVGSTYTTKDGKKTLKILKENDEWYSAEYNGTKLDIHEYDSQNKYGIFIGDKAGNGSQCGEYYLVVNTETKELIDLDYGNSYTYDVEKIGNQYYFIKRMCASMYSEAIYNESLNNVASQFLATSNNSFYAIKDGYITKFDSNGKELKHSSIKPDNKYELSLDGISIIDDNFYALVEVSSKLYLYDFSKDNKIELNNPHKSFICPDGNCGSGIASMGKVGNKLLITLSPAEEQKRLYENELAYLFDTTSNKLESIGNFLKFDQDKDYPEGNFYVYDNTYIYSYDKNGNFVKKSTFNYDDVFENPRDSGMYAIDGNYFILLHKNNEFYLQDVFSKEEYKLPTLAGYEFFNNEFEQSVNKIEIILAKEGVNNPNISDFKYYYFDVKTRKISENK